jgi:hypothetical protein
MDLDAAEEKMLRAIVQTAIAEAAAGRPFAGVFRGYRIGASQLLRNDHEWVQVEPSIIHRLYLSDRDSQGLVLVVVTALPTSSPA